MAVEVVVAVAVAMVARLVGLSWPEEWRDGVCVCVDTLDVVGYVVELKNAS